MPAPRLVDTDIASYLSKGRHPDVDARFVAADPPRLCISAITQAELLYGLKRLPPEHRLHLAVDRFLQTIRLLPWGERVARTHADLRLQLITNDNAIGEMDMMIAAHAVAVGAVLVTNNVRHYTRVEPPLKTENWASDPDD